MCFPLFLSATSPPSTTPQPPGNNYVYQIPIISSRDCTSVCLSGNCLRKGIDCQVELRALFSSKLLLCLVGRGGGWEGPRVIFH